MICFSVARNGQSAGPVNLAGAYVIGSDGVPLRADVEYRDAQVICSKRAEGPAGVVLVYPVGGCGALLLETSRLLDRAKPYNLAVELARGRLTRISQKREEWGLFDFEGVEPIAAEIDKARDTFVEALKADSPADQSRLAERALQLALLSGEQLTHFHAEVFMARRRQAHSFTKRNIGCTIDLENTSEGYRHRLREAFDFAHLPTPWRQLEPKPERYDWDALDGWVEWLSQHRIPIKMGPLVSLSERQVPAWLGDQTEYEAVRNLVLQHVTQVVDRYGSHVYQWDVVSGLHAENVFDFTFDQLMELTRVTTLLVKQRAPRANAIVDLVSPWGEYYARNQKTIPPMLYADMVIQSGISADGLGVQLSFGAPQDGMFVRDMFQISDKLDRLGNFGKPLHITAVQVPSTAVGQGALAGGGAWWKPWSEAVQARWIKEFCEIALSKPFVESITWRDLADRPEGGLLPSGGLLQADLTPKPSFKVLKDFRNSVLSAIRKPPRNASRER